MTNYWAISIGINQYELFQPLSCAQNDAETLKDFLVTAEGFLPQNSLLMTNTSPPIGEKSSHPTRNNILSFLEDLAKSWQPQDYLWFFFSGYGVNYNDKDYLMPADGNADQVLETGIEVRKIMESLAAAKLNVLLIFDINRAFGTQADAPVGQDIVNIAKELSMAVMLSCQPEQFSHESTELGHGFFTSAFMAALRSCPGGNLKDLESYVSALTPQLCQHHWRPIQNPATVIPENLPVMLPVVGLSENSEPGENIFPEESFAVINSTIPQTQETQPSTYKAWWAENRTANKSSQTTIGNNSDQDDGKSILATSPELNTSSRFIPASAKDYAKPTPPVSTPIWQQFIIWGGSSMVIVGLITTFLLRNQASFRFHKISTSLNNNTATTTRSSEFSDNLPPLPGNIPATSPSNIPRVSSSDPRQRNQAISELEKMSLSSTQASDLSQAITTTQKILPGQPLYQQAQENIQVWSQMMLDLAQEQAKQRKYNDAMATAALIPKNSLDPQGQATIEKLRLEAKQYVNNQTILDAAQGLIQPGQASTYNRAISVAKQVPPGQPGFDFAQQSMNKWSEEILELAKARAEQGDFTTAIETASLIPELTVAYEDAQDAIQKWQSKVK